MKEEKLKEIACKEGMLTTEEKKFVRAICEELGIYFKPKSTKCNECYKDAAVQCYGVLTRQGAEKPEDRRTYVLKEGVNVRFGTVIVNAATITDELAEWLLSHGFDKDFFRKCK